MKTLAAALASLLIGLPAVAQDDAFKQEMVKHWEIARDFTMAVADAMPADSYNFKPNPVEMSYGELMEHIALANANYVARAAGVKNPIAKPTSADKDTAKKTLTESFDFCIKTIEGLTPEQLDHKSGSPGHQLSGREAVLGGFTHMAHHRGQAEVYLRVKGITPPTYRF